MLRPLRLLLVEDDDNDATLILKQLRRDGFEPHCQRVEQEADYLRHLDDSLDVILSDYTLPNFNGATALRLRRERQLDVPFIVISGTIGEERAVEVLQHGASDYLLKDRLQRLGSVVTRALETRALQRQTKIAADALLRNQQRTQFALQAGGIGIWDWDAKTGRMHWSETLEQIHGLPPFSFGRTMDAFLECVHASDRVAVQAEIDRAVAEQRDAGLEYRTVWSDGATHFVSGKGRFLRDELGRVQSGVGIGIDVTERRQLEAQLVQAQKMEAIGQLAGGVAHDFNNLLTAILGYAELLKPRLSTDERLSNDLEQIRKSALRATDLTRQLLAFSRRQILQPAIVDLNSLVSDISQLVGRLIGEDVRLDLRLDSALLRTKADPGQIEQVIMNLAVNARDAMPLGGRLLIETANVRLGRETFRKHGVTNQTAHSDFVMLAISDTGTGMDEETKKHIFEPFFTTKAKGKGIGLGLATVYGIVKQSDGFIWVYSEPGEGTTFKIYLPRTEQPAVVETRAKVEPAPGGDETILLVEDEESVRLLSCALLERRGYQVIVASGAEHALAMIPADGRRVDLLLTDVVMPGLSGPELFARLQPLNPQLKVLYMSGYTDEAVVRRGLLSSNTAFLQKPFTATGLLGKVRDVLDAA